MLCLHKIAEKSKLKRYKSETAVPEQGLARVVLEFYKILEILIC